MELFSFRFVGITLIAVAIVSFWARKKRGKVSIIRGKRLSISGKKLSTFISKETPLVCLLGDGVMFGEDFKNKTIPELPHADGCVCQLNSVYQSSEEWLATGRDNKTLSETDMGPLSPPEYRYYKYFLIASHRDSDEKTREEYLELAGNISIDTDFPERVNRHVERR